MMLSMTAKHILLDWDGVVRADYYALRPGGDTPDAAERAANQEARERAGYNVHRVQIPDTAGDGCDIHDWDVTDYDVMVSPHVAARINALSFRPDVTVFWLTATGFLAPLVFGPAASLVHFDSSPFASDLPGQVGTPSNGFASRFWWKAEAVTRHLKETEADILWIDDSIYGDLQHHMGFRDKSNTRISFIRPYGRLGLSAGDLDAAERWADTGQKVARDFSDMRQSRARRR
jgi:hypothetical protein